MDISTQSLRASVLAAGLGIAGAAMVTPQAVAQVAGATSSVAVVATESSELALGWSVKRSVLGKPLYNDGGDKIGTISDLIVSPDKSASYMIIGVGGFLGLGKRDVAVPVTRVVEQDGKFVLPGASKSALAAMPAFTYASDTTRRAQFTRQAEQDLANARQQAADLRKKAGSASGDARQALDSQLSTLDAEIKAADARLTELRQASAEKWKQFEAKVSEALTRVKQSLHKATA